MSKRDILRSVQSRIAIIHEKKKAFKINVKIEDVGLDADKVSTDIRNGHYIFVINQDLKILHTASFYLSELFVALTIICVLIT